MWHADWNLCSDDGSTGCDDPSFSYILTQRQLQNHKIVEAGKDLWRFSPPPCSEQGQLEQVAQDHIQSDGEYLQWWRLHKFSEQPVPVSNHPHNTQAFPYAQIEFPMF